MQNKIKVGIIGAGIQGISNALPRTGRLPLKVPDLPTKTRALKGNSQDTPHNAMEAD